MIEKKIFTIWLNENPVLPDLVKKCIESQQIDGYTHKVITLDNCFKDAPYIQQFLKSDNPEKKWAKLSDYLRLHYLFTEGSIYLDSDVEILKGKNYNQFLPFDMFVGREESNFVATSVIGCTKGHFLIKKIMDVMETRFMGDGVGKNDTWYSGMGLFTDMFYANRTATDLLLDSEYFTPYCHEKNTVNITEKTISYHHFMKSWL